MNINEIIDTTKASLIISTNKFCPILYNEKNIELNLSNVLLPFGCEKFNDKIILNIELEDNNINNNIISKLSNLETNVTDLNILHNPQTKNLLKNKGYISIIKKSKLGNIIRTHIIKNTQIYITKKNGEKMDIDYINLPNTTCNIKCLIKGCWINENSYGLYIIVNSIEIIKFS
jgi:hypothetical protein